MTKRVLILCTGNSCRSQMAEFLWNHLGEGDWSAESAGSNPAGYVHPLAIEVMKELGLDLGNATSKHVDQFVDQPIDLVVTVCGGAKESCPTLPRVGEMLHWPFFDPADAKGSEEDKTRVFREVRDEIRTRIEHFFANADV
jgi:arsenate reductase (thioredoxin)